MQLGLRNMATVYLIKGDKVLLLFRQGGSVVNNVYTGSAGGHFEKDELNDPKACVLRELREETSLTEKDVTNLSLRYITMRNVNGEIRQNYYFFADLVSDNIDELKSNEGQLEWFTFEEAELLEMPFTAKFIFEHYIKIGRFDRNLYGGVATSSGLSFICMDE
ncbi:MAG: NUDIX domain-containing protein [Clostridia bacterium]|nr:NUDIX domain-containing protein [Clostridia bacterium]